MYLHSLAWLGALLGAVAWLYRRIEAAALTAGLAALLYAVDHVHGPAVAWLSNRNALIATFFGVLALIAHDRARKSGGARQTRRAGLPGRWACWRANSRSAPPPT